MKTIKLFLLITISLGTCKSQTPSWSWAKIYPCRYEAISCDQSNRVLGAGFHWGSMIFGTQTLSLMGATDVLITKHDEQGNELWAASGGGPGNDRGNSVSTDAAGNVYVTGVYSGTVATFGNFILNSSSTNINPSTMFVVKYNNLGAIQWAATASGLGNSSGIAIYADASGNAYITGSFESNLVIGSTTLTATMPGDCFIIKYNTSGIPQWVKAFHNISPNFTHGLCTDQNQNVFVTGYFTGPSFSLGTHTITNSGHTYLSKFDPSGNVLWLKGLDGPSFSLPAMNGIAADQSGNCLLTGYFYGSSLVAGTTTLNNNGTIDKMYLVKYDPSGNLLWAKTEGGTSLSRGQGLALDSQGNSYVQGMFGAASGQFGALNLPSSGTADIFITKYDAAGNEVWVQTCGGDNVDFGRGICVNSNDECFLAGYFLPTTTSFSCGSITANVTFGTAGASISKLGALSVGLSEGDKQQDLLEVFPNPSSDNITINASKDKELLKVRIIDVTGKLMFSSDLSTSDSKTIDISSLKASLYLIEIENEAGQIVRKKLVKE